MCIPSHERTPAARGLMSYCSTSSSHDAPTLRPRLMFACVVLAKEKRVQSLPFEDAIAFNVTPVPAHRGTDGGGDQIMMNETAIKPTPSFPNIVGMLMKAHCTAEQGGQFFAHVKQQLP